MARSDQEAATFAADGVLTNLPGATWAQIVNNMITKDEHGEFQTICDQCKVVLTYTGPEGAVVYTGEGFTEFRNKETGALFSFCADCMKNRSDLEKLYPLHECKEID